MFKFRKLLPWDIEKFRDAVRDTLIRSAPPTMTRTNEAIRAVFGKLVGGEAQAWILYRSDSQELYGMMITVILTEPMAGTKYLHMYALAATRSTTLDAWKIGLESLRKFAKENNCTVITGITFNPKVTEFAKGIGAKVDDLVSLEV